MSLLNREVFGVRRWEGVDYLLTSAKSPEDTPPQPEGETEIEGLERVGFLTRLNLGTSFEALAQLVSKHNPHHEANRTVFERDVFPGHKISQEALDYEPETLTPAPPND